MVVTRTHEIRTRGQGDAHDLTALAARAVSEAGARDGIVIVFVAGSTAGISTIEFEPGAVQDLAAAFEAIAPRDGEYRHHLRWGDDNGSSHVRAALLGPSVTVPFREGTLLLGTWQQIALFELDTRPRRRDVIMQVMGE